MKIVFFNRFFYPDSSATSQMLSDLAFHLAAKGRGVHVVTSRVPNGEAELETIRGVTVHRVANSAIGTTSLVRRALAYAHFYSGARKLAARLIQPGDIVVLKTDPPMLSAAIGRIARRKGARVVNWLQDIFPEVAQRYGIPGAGGITGGMLRWLRNRSLSTATRTVVIAEQMARHLEALQCIPAANLAVIHNWANGEAIRPVARGENALRTRWALDRAFVVGYSGNLGRVHEFDTLLGAAAKLREENDIRFLIVGRGPRLGEVMDRARRDGLDNIRFEPHQDQGSLALSLGAADIHISTLHPDYEGLVHPSKLYGVMAAGRPTVFIGDPRGETARILEEADAGITVPTGDSAGLAQVIRDLRATPARCKELGDHARAAFESKYDRRIALAKWEAMLDSLSAAA